MKFAFSHFSSSAISIVVTLGFLEDDLKAAFAHLLKDSKVQRFFN
jgi:hypothetical protein